MTTICKYCNEAENKQERPGLVCESCICFVHLVCLRRQGTPGDLACDVFFDFVCEDCSDDKKEIFTRNKFPWVNVIYLSLHHLTTQAYGISNHGYFHYKTHICHFIDRIWTVLFGTQLKQKKNWVGTIAGALSLYNNMLFRSGSQVLGETGWWRLMHNFTPAVAAHLIQEMGRIKQKNKQKTQSTMDRDLFLEKVTELGYKDLINTKDDRTLTPFITETIACKKRRVDSDELSAISSTSHLEYFDSDSRNGIPEDINDDPWTSFTSRNTSSYSDMEIFRTYDFTNPVPPSDSSSLHSFQQSMVNYDSDSQSNSPYTAAEVHSDENEDKPGIPVEQEMKFKNIEKEKTVTPLMKNSLFSSKPNSLEMPWRKDNSEIKKELIKLSEYEEVQLLKRVENQIQKIKDPNKKAELRRFRAKLAVRRLKRHKHLPVFDFDKTIRILGGYSTEDPRSVVNVERILDRFQTSYLMDNLCGTVASTNQGPLLISRLELAPFQSPYSGAMLKPYIRRDAETTPLWLSLMDELLRKTNRHTKDYSPPPHATIDYSYVQPQHIAAVNSLCAQHFWPGIDLTEALQYPEFSCIVTYKRLVVGCAFLVPDVSHNEAYISFVLTRPAWRRAKIATFMLYHLLQTCTGKDVTLHVSPTNSAIFLYQKFGFKVEELIQDFYEKYFDMEYKGCRHALFLRLVR